MFVLNLMLALFAVAADSSSVAGSEARHVAERFSIAYEQGDPSAVDYVFYTSRHVSEMGGTPEELEEELLPAELRKHRKEPAKVEMIDIRYSPSDPDYGKDVYYAVYLARGSKHTLCLHKIDGIWKVDIAYLWMGDWYDWMPGY